MSLRAINSKTILDDDPIRQERMIAFFTKLDNFLCERHNYKRGKCRPFINKIDARCGRFSLTLSYLHDDSAGISAISFKEKRKGHCTALVDFIDMVAIEHRIPRIKFISVLTNEMQSFLIKNNFRNYEPQFCSLERAYVNSKDWYRQTPFGIET